MDLILGAGCAGLSLARALVDAGSPDPIVLLDRRDAYTPDRTWCFWQTTPSVPRSGSASHTWHRWQFVSASGSVVEQTSRRHPYVRIDAADFYAEATAALAAAPGVDLRLGERVVAVDSERDGAGPGPGVRVRTTTETFAATRAYDAMGGGGPLLRGRPAGAIELRQSFLGLEIEAAQAAFDPAVATIMDFRCGPDAAGSLHFVYVLPTSPTRALVEHTTLGPGLVPAAERRRQIATYLRRHWGVDRYEVRRVERGVLPMTTHAYPVRRAPGLLAVGAAAGAVRPSSGYAFARLQRHIDALAAAIVTGSAVPERVGSARHATLDLLFLRALAANPPGFARTLLDFARRTDGDVFARFMSDASTLRDELVVMRSLLGARFLTAVAASSLLRPLPRDGALQYR